MKFSHQLQINSVSDWSAHYLAYSQLKKVIYQLEKDCAAEEYRNEVRHRGYLHPSARGPESAGARSSARGFTEMAIARNDDIFMTSLRAELDKIVAFFSKKESDLIERVDRLDREVYGEARSFGLSGQDYMGKQRKSSDVMDKRFCESLNLMRVGTPDRLKDEADDTDVGPLIPAHGGENSGHTTVVLPSPPQWRPSPDLRAAVPNASKGVYLDPNHAAVAPIASGSMTGTHIMPKQDGLHRQLSETYVDVCELINYITLNHTAFDKILKKYDKVMGVSHRESFVSQEVDRAYPFLPSTGDKMTSLKSRCESLYCQINPQMTRDEAVLELKTLLRDFISFQKNTIWRDLIAQERRVTALSSVRPSRPPSFFPSSQYKEVLGVKVAMPGWDVTRSGILVLVSTLVFMLLLHLPLMEDEIEQNCLAILAYVSMLWAFEALPLFVTSLMVPLLVVVFRVVRHESSHERMEAAEAAKFIISAMFSPVIMLLLGGFSLAAALSKHGIAKTMAQMVLNRVSSATNIIILANMMVALFASMWISNVAAPVLCFSLIQPILRTLPSNATSLAQALIIGIAMASNIGGMVSPISSPQNVVAIANMDPAPGWLQWFFISIPASILCTLTIWIYIVWTYEPSKHVPRLHFTHMPEDPFTGREYFIIAVTIVTIILWCIEPQLVSTFGNMGIMALIPVIVFFGTGLLTKEDFNNLLWTVIVLAMGGLALGTAVESSGLLKTVAVGISQAMKGQHVWVIMLVFTFLVMCVATFVSHTVAALIILPVVREVGLGLIDPHPRLLVMACALMSSGAMGLPISGFPNMNAVSQEDPTGKPYLHVQDFLKIGIPSSLVIWAYIGLFGFAQMEILGF